MSNILVTGSIAYDYIMNFSDVFARHILPEQLNILNVSFTADKMSKNFGGTAGNIAYSLNLLKENPVIFSTVGEDFYDYAQWLSSNGLDHSEICELRGELTASAHIITDRNSNQITAFHGGAMLKNDISLVPILEKYDISIGIIAANGKKGMLRHAREFKENNVPYIYDPGHSLPSFERKDILKLLEGSYMLIVNKYEEELLRNKAQVTFQDLLDMTEYVIITKGAQGSEIYSQGEKYTIKVPKIQQLADPTGAGDAYRGGLLKGLLYNQPLQTVGQLASLSACYAVEHPGTQNYSYDLANFKQRYIENYGSDPALDELFYS